MTQQTEAQRLAECLEDEANYDTHHETKDCMKLAAAELRRLEELSGYFQDAYGQEMLTSNELRRVNAELLEVLKGIHDLALTGESVLWTAEFDRVRTITTKHGETNDYKTRH